jgi:hypothetical protein
LSDLAEPRLNVAFPRSIVAARCRANNACTGRGRKLSGELVPGAAFVLAVSGQLLHELGMRKLGVDGSLGCGT